ncbi:hypothetical protein B0H10DRAFT_2192837 [Mycena sp. CBHHK59/15]|nr:hypothetical protein B0H10DRAFT_2192837 [Mycena sp. CBHHK59/15]
MSSRASTPLRGSDDPLSDVYDAMAQSSPLVPPAGEKRSHTAMLDNDSENEDDPSITGVAASTGTINQNVAVAAKRYAERKRLRSEQKTELDTFLKDPASLCEAKLFVDLLHVDNLINQIVIATAPYEVSASLEKNISNYAAAGLLPSKISTYKAANPTNILLAILKKHHFDLPAGIEHNPADWAKVVAAAQDALTQKRAKFKKAARLLSFCLPILKIEKSDKKYAPGPKRQNIFNLTQVFVDGTQCTVNVLLCARVALMRKVYLLESGPKFWDKLDSNLSQIRKQADGDKKKIIKAFRHILTQDQTTNGVKDYELDEDVDTFQKEVDDLIEAGATDAATSAQPEHELDIDVA